MKVVVLLSALSLGIAACAPVERISDAYGSTAPVAFTHTGKNYRVYDKPAENRLMITPSIAGAFAAGAAAGVTLGMGGDGIDPNVGMRNAAQAFVAGRGCTLTAGRVLLHPQYEFDYTC